MSAGTTAAGGSAGVAAEPVAKAVAEETARTQRIAAALNATVRPIKGPSALSGSPRRFFALTWTLGQMEFRLKFFGSVLGYFWQLARPLMLFGVLYVVFTQAFKLGNSVPHYPVVLLMGIVTFSFFAEATVGAVGCVVERENLVRKIHFPRLVIPLSVVLTALLNFCVNFIAILVFMFASGVKVRWSWLELPFLILFLGIFATGVAMILSAAYVRFRDVSPIWEVISQALFYSTPIIYPLERISSMHVREIMMASPVGAVIQQLRHAVIDPTAYTAGQAIGGDIRLLVPIGVTVLTFVGGLALFNRMAPQIAEEL